MTLVTQAAFARHYGVSRKTVTAWKSAGKLVMAGDQVDQEKSAANLVDNSRGKSKAHAGPVTRAVTLPSGNTAGNKPGNTGRNRSGAAARALELAQLAAAVADGTTGDAALLMLRHLSLEVVRPLVGELLAMTRKGAIVLLDEDGQGPPPGYPTWASHPLFVGECLAEADWMDLVEEARPIT